jgi:2Fe-2S ferredoxin
MLENAAAERRPNSRLACQIKVSPALDGLVLRLPATQE